MDYPRLQDYPNEQLAPYLEAYVRAHMENTKHAHVKEALNVPGAGMLGKAFSSVSNLGKSVVPAFQTASKKFTQGLKGGQGLIGSAQGAAQSGFNRGQGTFNQLQKVDAKASRAADVAQRNAQAAQQKANEAAAAAKSNQKQISAMGKQHEINRGQNLHETLDKRKALQDRLEAAKRDPAQAAKLQQIRTQQTQPPPNPAPAQAPIPATPNAPAAPQPQGYRQQAPQDVAQARIERRMNRAPKPIPAAAPKAPAPIPSTGGAPPPATTPAASTPTAPAPNQAPAQAPATQQPIPASGGQTPPAQAPPAGDGKPTFSQRLGLDDGSWKTKALGLGAAAAGGLALVKGTQAAVGSLENQNHHPQNWGAGGPIPAYGVNEYGVADRSIPFSPY